MKLLDLFCGAGGAAAGYALAGWHVTGVDLRPQHRYPLMDLIQGDALAVLDDLAFCRTFDAIHASPPCQRYSVATPADRRHRHPDLVATVRVALDRTGVPYVIENVPGAPLRPDVILCGSMFGLDVQRHRLFESNTGIRTPLECRHTGDALSVYGHAPQRWRGGTRTPVSFAEAGAAMGVEWMSSAEIVQAIPPVYTEHLGRLLQACSR